MRWIAVAACLTSCYSPRLDDCRYSCGPAQSCPADLRCNNNVCRIPENINSACLEPDGGAVTADVNPEDCTWQLVSSNFSPVDVPDASPPPWDVIEDEPFLTGGVIGKAVAQTDTGPLWIVHRSRFTVAAGKTLTITGMHPLVIAADEIDIKGTIIALNGTPHSTCNAMPGADSCDAGAGGGGGGYGGMGGDGGGPPPNNGGNVEGVLHVPLRSGCPGMKGGNGKMPIGDNTPKLGGAGGAAGGALQLSARLSIRIDGTILANGFGGGPGLSDPPLQGTCGMFGRASGGGGGGGGGTIIIESCATVLKETAKLCANGGSGGGGAGGGTSTANTGMPGRDGSCDMQAVGGLGEFGASHGGNGGYDGMFDATNGLVETRGGGGGGGAVGRIHVQQVAGNPVTFGATIKPPANRSQ